MPQFGRNGNLHTVAWITGPTHLWLGLQFAREVVPEPVIVRRPAIGSCDHGAIDPVQLVSAVVAGAREHGLHPAHIEYVENDSPDYGAYAHCARLLAERAAAASEA